MTQLMAGSSTLAEATDACLKPHCSPACLLLITDHQAKPVSISEVHVGQ